MNSPLCSPITLPIVQAESNSANRQIKRLASIRECCKDIKTLENMNDLLAIAALEKLVDDSPTTAQKQKLPSHNKLYMMSKTQSRFSSLERKKRKRNG